MADYKPPSRFFDSAEHGGGYALDAMSNSKTAPVGRRRFLKGAASAAALVVTPPSAGAQPAPTPSHGAAAVPSPSQVAAETSPPPPRTSAYTVDRPGSDFMVDVIKSLGFEYVAANPGSSFRGLHESVINYGGNKSPELLTCCHEESSVAMAHGYAKIEGKPMMVMAHGTVGLQHASMAIYNAYADRVPVYIVLGNILDVAYRRSVVEWTHSVQDAAAMVRDYTKWDDAPMSLTHFAESAVRAYKIAMTPRDGAGGDRRRCGAAGRTNSGGRPGCAARPEANVGRAASGDSAAIAEAARMLVAAEQSASSSPGAARARQQDSRCWSSWRRHCRRRSMIGRSGSA